MLSRGTKISGLIGVSKACFPRVEEATNPLGFIFAADLGVNLKCGLGAAFFTFVAVGVIVAPFELGAGDGGAPLTERLGIESVPKGDPVMVACFGCCIVVDPPKEGKDVPNPGEGLGLLAKPNPREGVPSELGLLNKPFETLEGAGVPKEDKEEGVVPNRLVFPPVVFPNKLFEGKKELDVEVAVVEGALENEKGADVEGAGCWPGNEKGEAVEEGAVVPKVEARLKLVLEVVGCPKVEVEEAGCPNVEVVDVPKGLLVELPKVEGVEPKVEVEGVLPKELPNKLPPVEGAVVEVEEPNPNGVLVVGC